MKFNIVSAAGKKLKQTEIEIKNGQILIDLMTKHKCDLIIRNKNFVYEKPTIQLYDAYVE